MDRRAAERAAWGLLAWIVVVVGALEVGLRLGGDPALIGIVPIVPALVVVDVLAWRMVRGTRLNPVSLAVGGLWLFGGAAFDMIATIVRTPDLSMEANPIAVALRDAGVPVAGIVVFAIVAQLGFQVFKGLGLWAWIVWRPVYATAPMGLRGLALRGLVLVGLIEALASWGRWYLGLEWTFPGVFPPWREAVFYGVAVPLGLGLDALAGVLARADREPSSRT